MTKARMRRSPGICFDGSCASPGILDARTTAEAIALVLRRTSGLED
jgi:hypothetical protein